MKTNIKNQLQQHAIKCSRIIPIKINFTYKKSNEVCVQNLQEFNFFEHFSLCCWSYQAQGEVLEVSRDALVIMKGKTEE